VDYYWVGFRWQGGESYHPFTLEYCETNLEQIGVSLNELARALRVPMNRNGKHSITVDTSTRLARYFGTSPQYWLNLQNAYAPETADRAQVETEVLPRNAA
jgi:addiction module HigA family antidote